MQRLTVSMLLMVLILLLIGQVSLSFTTPHLYSETPHEQERSSVQGYLAQVFQTALLNNFKNLYSLQRGFFKGDSIPARMLISVNITVGSILNTLTDHNSSCQSVSPGFTRCHPFLNQTTECWQRKIYSKTYGVAKSEVDLLGWKTVTNELGELTELIENPYILETILDLDYHTPVFLTYIPLSYGATDVFLYLNYTSIPLIFLELKIPVLEFMPCNNDIVEALESILIWAKAYARSDKSCGRSENDRGAVKYCCGHERNDLYLCVTNTLYGHSTCYLVVATFISLNLLITFAGSHYLSTVTQDFLSEPTDVVRHSYWATVILVGMFNLCAFAADLMRFALKIKFGDTIGYAITTKITLIIVTLVSEPCIAWNAAKHVKFSGNISCNICCFHCMKLSCCKPCHSRNWKLNRCIQTLALCHILWFVHRLASGAIVAVFYIINNAPLTLSAIAIIFLVFFCIFRMLYSSFRTAGKFNTFDCKAFLYVLLNVLFWIVLITSVILVSYLYLVLLHYGLNYSPLSGLILSAIPPTALFLLGLYIKDRTSNDSVRTANTMPEDSAAELEVIVSDTNAFHSERQVEINEMEDRNSDNEHLANYSLLQY